MPKEKAKITKTKPEQPKPKPGLEALVPALGSTIAALKNIWFDVSSAYASDARVGIIIPYKSKLKLGVPGKVLIDLIKSSPEQPKLERDGDTLMVVMGRSRASLATTAFSEKSWGFPRTPPKSAKPILITKELLAAFSRVTKVKAKVKKTLLDQGVIAIAEAKGWALYGTEFPLCLARTRVNIPLPKGLEPIIFPHEFVDVMVEHAQPDDELFIMDKYIAIYGKDISIFCSMLDTSEMRDVSEPMSRLLDMVKQRDPIPEGFASALTRAKVLAGTGETIVQIASDGKELAVTGKFKFGNLEEKLSSKLPTSVVKLDATRLAGLVEQSDELSMVPKAAALFGKDVVFLLAAHGA